MLTSAVQTPHFTASAPRSIAPCSLYAPSLSFYPAATRTPPPPCHQDGYLLPLVTLATPSHLQLFGSRWGLMFVTHCQSGCFSEEASRPPVCQFVSWSLEMFSQEINQFTEEIITNKVCFLNGNQSDKCLCDA